MFSFIKITHFPFLVFFLLTLSWNNTNFAFTKPIPFPKHFQEKEGELKLKSVKINPVSPDLNQELELLKEILESHKIKIQPTGTPITLAIKPFDLSGIPTSRYKEQIEAQAYKIEINAKGIYIIGRSSQGVFYALQTFDQLIDESAKVPFVEITDWPDLAIRMIMIDPARQNENMGYYQRLIKFAGRYKINAILCHLTDDQTSCLYHEDYPELMHPYAWSTQKIQHLVAFAKKYYVELIPEIESFGHSRMFTRRADCRDFLHMTKSRKPGRGWYGTEIPGYTNVLCPASHKALEYLDKMYERAVKGFGHPWIHIGCDEVDITECERCQKAFPGLSPAEWILKHLLQCRNLVLKRAKTVALWGDMLLHYPEVLNELPTTHTIIFDWHYKPDVSGKSTAFFKEKGFTVIACPALVCYPHIIMPDKDNFENIRRFTDIARDNDILGVNTTIWIPTRYMSDVLWLGIAYAGSYAWSGSNWDEEAFHKRFLLDFFGSKEGEVFQKVWTEVTSIIWHLQDFNISCWDDEDSLNKARKMAEERRTEIEQYIQRLDKSLTQLERIGNSVKKNSESWETFIRSIKILRYTMKHLLASLNVKNNGKWNRELIEDLDKECLQAIKWIEEDWDRNRYPDDPNKNGLYLQIQHLLYRFKQMHGYHQEILSKINPEP